MPVNACRGLRRAAMPSVVVGGVPTGNRSLLYAQECDSEAGGVMAGARWRTVVYRGQFPCFSELRSSAKGQHIAVGELDLPACDDARGLSGVIGSRVQDRLLVVHKQRDARWQTHER